MHTVPIQRLGPVNAIALGIVHADLDELVLDVRILDELSNGF